MKYSKRNLYQIQKADTYKKQVLVIPIHAMHFFWSIWTMHMLSCVITKWKFLWSGMGNLCQPLGP